MMKPTRKWWLLDMAHSDGCLETRDILAEEVVELNEAGYCDYATVAGGTDWNTLLITHEGRRELVRLREFLEDERSARAEEQLTNELMKLRVQKASGSS